MPSTATGATGGIIPSGLSSLSHHQFPFLGSMHPPGHNLGLAFSAAGLPPLGMRHHLDTADQLFPVASGGGSTIGSSLEQWRVQQQPQQQFPFLAGEMLEFPPPPPTTTMYQLGLEANRGGSGGAFTLGQTSATTARQEGSVKLDSKGQDQISLQRQYMAALRHGSEGVWDGNAGGGSSSDGGGNGGASWPMNIIPGFHSSSTGGGNGGGLL
uniref:Uncharacterized protein n=1 Tax=Arundo donax TaxID=35708 RepID=A0A0A8YLB1_ARUDO